MVVVVELCGSDRVCSLVVLGRSTQFIVTVVAV